MPNLMNVRNVALAAAGLALILTGAWINGLRWESRYNAYVAKVEKAQAKAELQARAEEQRRQTAIEGIRRDAKDKIDQAAADAAAADAHAVGLQQLADKLARRPASCPGTAAGSETADPTRLLLADLFRRADEIAGDLAAYADGARIAGEVCVKGYGVLSP